MGRSLVWQVCEDVGRPRVNKTGVQCCQFWPLRPDMKTIVPTWDREESRLSCAISIEHVLKWFGKTIFKPRLKIEFIIIKNSTFMSVLRVNWKQIQLVQLRCTMKYHRKNKVVVFLVQLSARFCFLSTVFKIQIWIWHSWLKSPL